MPSIDTTLAQEPAVVTEAKKVPKIAESAVLDAKSAVADQSPVNDEAAAETSVEAVNDEVKDNSVAVVMPADEIVAEEGVVTKSDDAEEPAEAIDPEMVALYAEFNAYDIV
ncbi:hypothetical protein EWM64_g1749 [Hericium alpestre]|uniref:Uncharacterized protein n=1 Tax=Hericium alpestre TaxID=135208 RepID=A0A4Z0A7L4_9AGAM|nr:hypothetical protein EWM64_g1749 [Hericium alpestre]